MEAMQDRRFAGPRWGLFHGACEGVQRTAVYEMQRMAQAVLPYVVETRPWEGSATDHALLVGTAQGHAGIREMMAAGRIPRPEGRGGYALASMAAPWDGGKRCIAVAGADGEGTLHGVQDLAVRLAGRIPDHPSARIRALDTWGDWTVTERPAATNRGIWTWGYVIYDYRRFLDHMMRLRMNMIVIWNDVPPINSREVIAYAHDRGIRVVFGFPWGWGFKVDPANPEHRAEVKAYVLDEYRQRYAGLNLDGLYFQTFTEHNDEMMGGRSTASWACEWVNEIAADLFSLAPELRLYFGVHASSILGRYVEFEALDPRVRLMWEDAGCLPYGYDPMVSGDAGAPDQEMPRVDIESMTTRPQSQADTTEYSRRLAMLRGGREFALVPKGWICLRWDNEFEHHGPYVMGERAPDFIRQRAAQRRSRWDYVNRLWLRNFGTAAAFYRDMLDTGVEELTACGLVEDGLFEERIEPSVALLGETLWNPRRPDRELLERAMSAHYLRD